MKNFLRGMVLGGMIVYVGMAVAQTRPTTLKIPPIATSGMWTQAQRRDLEAQWANFVNQQNQINTSLAEQKEE